MGQAVSAWDEDVGSFEAGVVRSVNDDGSYDIAFDTGAFHRSVPGDKVKASTGSGSFSMSGSG